jgi:hypothetical protein
MQIKVFFAIPEFHNFKIKANIEPTYNSLSSEANCWGKIFLPLNINFVFRVNLEGLEQVVHLVLVERG